MFTAEVLDLARKLTAEIYPWDSGTIHVDCLRVACRQMQAQGYRTLILS